MRELTYDRKADQIKFALLTTRPEPDVPSQVGYYVKATLGRCGVRQPEIPTANDLTGNGLGRFLPSEIHVVSDREAKYRHDSIRELVVDNSICIARSYRASYSEKGRISIESRSVSSGEVFSVASNYSQISGSVNITAYSGSDSLLEIDCDLPDYASVSEIEQALEGVFRIVP